MGREIEAERLALGGHALREGPCGVTRQPNRRKLGGGRSEQRGLAALALLMRARGMGEDRLRRAEYCGPLELEPVERARARQTF